MEEVCERGNCLQAYKRVKANKGNPGIDGTKVGELSGLPPSNKREVGSRSLRVGVFRAVATFLELLVTDWDLHRAFGFA